MGKSHKSEITNYPISPTKYIKAIGVPNITNSEERSRSISNIAQFLEEQFELFGDDIDLLIVCFVRCPK